MGMITLGYKFVYNTIYKAAYHTELNYYKFLDNKLEAARMPFRIILGYKQKQQDKSAAVEGDTTKLQEIMDRLRKDKK